MIMKKYILNNRKFIILFLLNALVGCTKQDEFLDAKPNQALTVPTSLNDFALLLNNEVVFNAYSQPALGTLHSDEVNVTTANFNNQASAISQNAFTFQSDVFKGSTYFHEWNQPYNQVFIANIVLDGLAKLKDQNTNLSLYNEVKGTALFYRAFAFYNLVQTFALPYDPANAKSDLGIPLRLSPVLTDKVQRASVEVTYERIINDLKETYTLLPNTTISPRKPSKAAVNAMLSRVYFAMGDYPNALLYAEKCLATNKKLTDYNTIVPRRNNLSQNFLDEVIYTSCMINYGSIYNPDSTIYKSYNINDLRKNHFFRASSVDGSLVFRGTYDVNGDKFCGLATDEIYLIRAECFARTGKTKEAMGDLNLLLKNRFKTGTFAPVNAPDAEQALKLILEERKKELLFRGIRWTDLRRLNREERFKKTVVHIVNGKTYTLQPGSLLYAISIPEQEIQLNGIQQNPR